MIKRQWQKAKAAEDPKEVKDEGYQKPPFDCDKIYKLISDIVENASTAEDESGKLLYENIELCNKISQDIRDSLKLWTEIQKYRIVAIVSLVEKNSQGIHYKLTSSIDARKDCVIKYLFDNLKFFVVVCVVLVNKD